MNSIDPFLYSHAKKFGNPITYSQKDNFCPLSFRGANPFVQYEDEHWQLCSTQLVGKHHFDTIGAALCIAKYFSVPLASAHQKLAAYLPTSNRGQVIQKGSNQIILDAYNANPTTVKSALQSLEATQLPHKVVILGDMEELGEESGPLHREIVALTQWGNYHKVILCGPKMVEAAIHNASAHSFLDKEPLTHYLDQKKFENTTFLIKGSRSLALETLVNHIHP